jgi:hypothetical protein
VLLGVVVITVASCGGVDDGSAGAANAPAESAPAASGADRTDTVPGWDALEGVVFDVRRDPG